MDPFMLCGVELSKSEVLFYFANSMLSVDSNFCGFQSFAGVFRESRYPYSSRDRHNPHSVSRFWSTRSHQH
ncbi:hypothetical protein MUK42_37672 [Musa troglodytarum]|uniref:Uncharacterized protein n=1 Tax=Musa troglodytarum TaxID=320322 RepID=A0A9E7EFI5_9LILI|nr:hypothetical protein MUK42_37672 [Musa troglodytarum]